MAYTANVMSNLNNKIMKILALLTEVNKSK